VYESRPNVTADAAALCLKSGNACLLRGGSEAIHSNRALARLQQVLGDAVRARRNDPAAHDDFLQALLEARYLDDPRIRAVLEKAAKQFRWAQRVAKKQPGVGVGLACGTEKGSVVAACVEVAIDGGEFRDVFPVDHLLDTAVERFEVDLGELAAGPHVVAVRATDANGNAVTAEVEHSPRR